MGQYEDDCEKEDNEKIRSDSVSAYDTFGMIALMGFGLCLFFGIILFLLSLWDRLKRRLKHG